MQPVRAPPQLLRFSPPHKNPPLETPESLHFQIYIVVASPTKNSVLGRFSSLPMMPPPLKSTNFIFIVVSPSLIFGSGKNRSRAQTFARFWCTQVPPLAFRPWASIEYRLRLAQSPPNLRCKTMEASYVPTEGKRICRAHTKVRQSYNQSPHWKSSWRDFSEVRGVLAEVSGRVHPK